MNETPDCIIFDRDGTILDFSEMFYQFISQIFNSEGLEVPDRSTILSLQFWLEITRNNLRIGRVLVRDYVDDVPRKFMQFGHTYPGVSEALRKLHLAGVRMGIVSGWVGTKPTETWLESVGLINAFPCVLTVDDLQGDQWDYLHTGYLNAKIALFDIAVRKLSTSVVDSWIVGDSPEDIAAANKLGVKAIAVMTGNGQRLCDQIAKLKPHWIIDSAAEIYDRIFPARVGDIAGSQARKAAP